VLFKGRDAKAQSNNFREGKRHGEITPTYHAGLIIRLDKKFPAFNSLFSN
jgi:hypothetical protein